MGCGASDEEVRAALPGDGRLVVRERYGYTRPWAPLLIEPVELVSFVMTQKMLRGIRARAERSAALASGLDEGS